MSSGEARKERAERFVQVSCESHPEKEVCERRGRAGWEEMQERGALQGRRRLQW